MVRMFCAYFLPEQTTQIHAAYREYAQPLKTRRSRDLFSGALRRENNAGKMYSPLTGVILILLRDGQPIAGLTHLRLAGSCTQNHRIYPSQRCVAIARKKASSSASKQRFAMPSSQSRGPALLLPKNFGAHERDLAAFQCGCAATDGLLLTVI